jgi:RNA polymerase sigma-70 factor (ECF subfamily)
MKNSGEQTTANRLDEFKAKANIVGDRLCDGREVAMDELISLYQNKIYTIAIRFTGNREEAFDLSQEIFLRAYSKIKLYKRETDFNAWFLRLAVNTAINYKTKVMKNPSFAAGEIDQDMEHNLRRNNEYDNDADQKKLNRLLNKLPKRERIVLIMQILEERKVSEIATILGITVKSTESLLTRARKRLRILVEKNEGL